MDFKQDLELKRERILDYINQKDLDGVLLCRNDNFAWATGGAVNWVAAPTDYGAASLLVTPSRFVVLTTNIEATRFKAEEPVAEHAEIWGYPWNNPHQKADMLRTKLSENLGCDDPSQGYPVLDDDFLDLQKELTEREVNLYKQLGQECTEVVEGVAKKVKPGQSENEAAAMLRYEAQLRGIFSNVVLVAADDRLKQHRHPHPTDNKIENIVMLVLCGRRHGLIANLTRIVAFGRIDDDLHKRHEAVTHVDATGILNTTPGMRVGNIYDKMVAAYADAGYRGEENLHHQGGPTGYKGRYYTATGASGEVVRPNQAFAWNPSITGTKSEDTIIAGPDGRIDVTRPLDYPVIDVTVEGKSIKRADILVRG